ncbi:MAG: hypothetical protein ACLTXL_15585 [Clostridia bacterium]
MKVLDFDLEGSHFIIEADIAPRQEADDDMGVQWLRYDFDNTQVYKETDGAVSPFQITAVAWAGYQLTADHALSDVIGRISRNETGKLAVSVPNFKNFSMNSKNIRQSVENERFHISFFTVATLQNWRMQPMSFCIMWIAAICR